MVENDFHPPSVCPVCGDDVPPGAKACPGCGADERSGWDEDAALYDGLDLPDATGSDEPAVPPARPRRSGVVWIVVGLGLLILFVLSLIFN